MDQSGGFVDDKSLISIVTSGSVIGGSGGSNISSVELCLVCGDRASGRHYGAISCEGCKGFFKRSIRKQLGYQCRGTMNCEVTKHHRNRCQFCRLQKCLASGMRSDSVQHERKPIIDKKEPQSPSNSSTLASGSGCGANSANQTIYHHRNKMFNHQSGNSTSSASAAAAAAVVAAATVENIAASASLNVFPVGFNFADITQTLSKRAMLAAVPFQQQQQQQQQQQLQSQHSLMLSGGGGGGSGGGNGGGNGQTGSTSSGTGLATCGSGGGNQIRQDQSYNSPYSPGTQTNDDDSMDNSTASIVQNNILAQNLDNVAAAAATNQVATNLIQASIDKVSINQSLEMLASIQINYDNNLNRNSISNSCNNHNNIINSGNDCSNSIATNNTTSTNSKANNNNNNNENDSISSENCNFTKTIVKSELIIDDQHDSVTIVKNSDNLATPSNRGTQSPSHHDVCNSGSGSGSTDDQQDNNNSLNSQQQQYNQLFSMPILPDSNVNFNLQPPNLVPSYLNGHYVCESGSRLLFLSVHWIKKITCFAQLPDDIQVNLLKLHWVELFAIGLAQCSKLLSMSTIITTLISNIVQLTEIDNIQALKIRKLSEHTCLLNEFVQTLQTMDLDDHEYAYIRLIIIMSPDGLSIKDINKRSLIKKIQQYALNSLKLYLTEINHPELNDRCNQILLRLMQLKSLEPDLVEELFFLSLIGQVQIENMIPYILKVVGGGV